jgi:hypothetical protein
VIKYHNSWKPHGAIQDNTYFNLPNVFELFPEYEQKMKTEKSINDLSCADMAEQAPEQTGFVNHTCAAIAINYLHSLFSGRSIGSHMTFFSINNVFEHRPITKTLIDEWATSIPRFKGIVVA